VFLDLVDLLCCPRPHRHTSLVASVRTRRGRQLIDGSLGCPECRAEFESRDGVVFMEEPPPSGGAASDPVAGAAGDPVAGAADDPEHVLRAAALLGLSEAGGLVLLGGRWGALARTLATTTGTGIVTLNAPRTLGDDPDGVSRMSVGDRLPFRAKSVRGAALDDSTMSPLLEAVATVLQPRGRLVLPASAAAPAWARRLAADRDDAVYESTASWSDARPAQ
jgi:uncharacterized protein YbaR (Trm112 family)